MPTAAMICAGAICLGVWSVLGSTAGYLAHRRMRSVERALGARAEPANENRYLWYAGAAHVWLAAAVLALMGLVSRKWARTGRDATFILLGHLTVITLGALFLTHSTRDGFEQNVLPFAVLVSLAIGTGFTAALIFGFLWASLRVRRIEALPPLGPPPGVERYAIYVASFLLWPAGPIAAAVYGKPENVRVGATALRLSLAQIWIITAAVCVGVPVLVALHG